MIKRIAARPAPELESGEPRSAVGLSMRGRCLVVDGGIRSIAGQVTVAIEPNTFNIGCGERFRRAAPNASAPAMVGPENPAYAAVVRLAGITTRASSFLQMPKVPWALAVSRMVGSPH
jgi:hypothetical protein